MSRKTKAILDLIFNLVIIASTVLAVGYYFVGGPDVLGSAGPDCFKYFTTDSNVLVAITAAVMLVFNVRELSSEKKPPKWAVILKYVGTVSVAITLVTVVFFLAPTGFSKGGWESVWFFFKDNVFALHLSTPVLAIVAFMAFERTVPLTFKDSLWTLSSTVVYSVVYLILVVFVKIWTDWYGFTFGGKLYLAPVSMLVMYLVTLLIAALLRIGQRKAE